MSMDILDNIMRNIFADKPQFQSLFQPPKEKAVFEGYNPLGQSQAQDAGQGNVFITKQNAQGGMTRLRRPEANPFTQNEMEVPNFSQYMQPQNQYNLYPQRQGFSEAFSGVSNNVKRGGFNILNKLGQITGLDGSSLWKHGLDVDLQRGDPVPAPMSGKVTYVGPRGGFGNQVRIQGDDGREYWLSHLDAARVRVGDMVGAGQTIGLGGNTGNTIPGPGGDGSHLDLTVRENGRYVPARSIADLLRAFG